MKINTRNILFEHFRKAEETNQYDVSHELANIIQYLDHCTIEHKIVYEKEEGLKDV